MYKAKLCGSELSDNFRKLKIVDLFTFEFFGKLSLKPNECFDDVGAILIPNTKAQPFSMSFSNLLIDVLSLQLQVMQFNKLQSSHANIKQSESKHNHDQKTF